MALVRRLFVEKKEGFDLEAGRVLADLRDTLGIPGLEALRLFNRYDVEGLGGADFDTAAATILSEPNADRIYDRLPDMDASLVFAVEYLPGQYDQRADSASQCIALLTLQTPPKVLTARVYALFGRLTAVECEKIKNYLVNPVEARLASMEPYDSLDLKTQPPAKIADVAGFLGMDVEAMARYHASMGFAMSVEDLLFCRDYFLAEGRDPTETELRVIDTYWSDHCRHTTFLTRLERVEVRPGGLSAGIEAALNEYMAARAELYAGRQKDISLMDMATIGGKLLAGRGLAADVDVSEEINACSIEAEVIVDGEPQRWLVQFKNETHNHPTEIEPFGGAATCLGGAIRDPLSGRAYVYQAMRVTGSGNPLTPFEQTVPGKLPQKKITVGAAQGYSSYGNQIGLATGQVTELYDEGYVAKRLEIGAVIGASPKSNVRREAPAPGDVVVLLGGRTGRDGCGGATGSSKAHDSSSIETCGAEVQKGNPPPERKLQRLFRDPAAARLIKRCNDFGAGGVSVAIGELARGLDINLDAVPKKYEGLGGTELAISESQERMAVVLAPSDVETFCALAAGENLEATPVAVVTENPRLVMRWQGDTIVDIGRDFLDTNGVTQTARAEIAAVSAGQVYRDTVPSCLDGLSGAAALEKNLSRLEVCSQKGLAERFDASIGAGSVLMPFAGKYQMTPEDAMCAKLPLLEGETDTATAMSFGFIPGMSRWSPFHGAVYAIAEALAKLACIGADPLKSRLTLQEYFERLRDVPERWGKPAAALLGALTAQLNFGVPAIGGKDSMSGSFNDMDVPPTLVCFAVAMTKASETGSAAMKKAGSRVVLIDFPVVPGTLLPDWQRAKEMLSAVCLAVKKGVILSASCVREGGAAAAVCRMAMGNRLGFAFESGLSRRTLYAPLCGCIVAELAGKDGPEGLDCLTLGFTNDSGIFTVEGENIPLASLEKAYLSKLAPVFPVSAPPAVLMPDIPLFRARSDAAPAVLTAKPRVLIPVFPGTNCEVDTARAFEKAGAQPVVFVVRNLTPADADESIRTLARLMAQSQILMLPGGFSGGDEPDGSGKFIATVLRNARIKEAVEDLLERRKGLVLGICNGFQALIKTGLLPGGKISPIQADSPTLTFNNIGRHVSQMVYTQVSSVMSPWFALCEPGEIHAVPVSHGEGRFTADEATLLALTAAGQIATRYVDADGRPQAGMPFNPNGSAGAVEGITSPDGRVLGKMAHSERKGENICKNVPFSKDQKIFESGVAYFR